MPDLSLKSNLIPLHAWLIEAGTNDAATETLFDGFCGRLVAAGVPIARGFLSIAGLHPLRRAYSLTWNDGRIVEVTDFGHASLATAVWQASPFATCLKPRRGDCTDGWWVTTLCSISRSCASSATQE